MPGRVLKESSVKRDGERKSEALGEGKGTTRVQEARRKVAEERTTKRNKKSRPRTDGSTGSFCTCRDGQGDPRA